jgi:hypothetical protein
MQRGPNPADSSSAEGLSLVLAATPTGLEPATSAVTGRRANQLRYGALCGALFCAPASGGTLTHPRLRKPIGHQHRRVRTPNGIRTRATAVKGRRPRPLDDGGLSPCGNRHIIGPALGPPQIAWQPIFVAVGRLRYGFRAHQSGAGSSVGTSVRLKSGRSAVRPRPCPRAPRPQVQFVWPAASLMPAQPVPRRPLRGTASQRSRQPLRLLPN